MNLCSLAGSRPAQDGGPDAQDPLDGDDAAAEDASDSLDATTVDATTDGGDDDGEAADAGADGEADGDSGSDDGGAIALCPSAQFVDVSNGGVKGVRSSSGYAISDDGLRVAFASIATNLVPDDTNDLKDVFLRDVASGTTTLISVGVGGEPANDVSGEVSVDDRLSISGDGTLVAFESSATNLVAGDTNGADDIFVANTGDGTIERVSVTSAGEQLNGGSRNPWFSSDGRYVFFSSGAGNLFGLAQRSNMRDLQLDVTLPSRDLVTAPSPAIVTVHGMSTDNRFVVFQATEVEVVPAEPTFGAGLYVRDQQLEVFDVIVDDARNGSISDDGRLVAFQTEKAIVPSDTNGPRFGEDVYLHDRTAQTTRRLGVRPDGTQANGRSFNPMITADGRWVVFSSTSTDIVDREPTTNGYLVYAWNTQTDEAKLLADDLLDPVVDGPQVSRDGRSVVYLNSGENLYLVPLDCP